MTIDITLEPETEQVILILDNTEVLKANKGLLPKEVKLNKAFRKLEEEDDKLFKLLRKFAVDLLLLE
jgi:hypothetical protein